MSDPVKHPSSEEACKILREKIGPRILLAFSNGKDSVGAWLQLSRYFDEVCPYYLEAVPGLPFIEKGLRYYEGWFKRPILRIPSDQFWNLLVLDAFQHLAGIRASAKKVVLQVDDPYDLDVMAALHYGLDPDNFWIADGMRAQESLGRALMMKKRGPMIEVASGGRRGKRFHCVYDWSDTKLYNELKAVGLKLPCDYRLFGRSFDSLQNRFTGPIRARLPKSFAVIEKWFPLIRLEQERYRDEFHTSSAAWIAAHPREWEEHRKARKNR